MGIPANNEIKDDSDGLDTWEKQMNKDNKTADASYLQKCIYIHKHWSLGSVGVS
jgi:hypothetical protein